MGRPIVSALVDTYNHERYIERALLSVLSQDLSPSEMEIVVIDDGSTDQTPAIVQNFVPRIRYLRKTNGGQASAFNAAIPELRGSIVAFLDGDDWWASGKLRAVLEIFEENPGLAAVGHGFFEVYGDAPPHEMFVPEKTCRLDLSSTDAARLADLGRTLLGTSRLAVRKEVLDRIGPIPLELTFCADTPILTLALALGGAIVLEQPLCYYRRHLENLFASDSRDKNELRRRCEILAFLIKFLPPRLSELGVGKEIIAALLETDRLELNRLQLYLGEGGRWRSFKTELQAFRWTYKSATPGYMLFRGLVGALAIVLSPRRFNNMRDLYARRNLRRLRRILGEAEPSVSPALFQRRPVVPKSTGTHE
jgi:glycosyltransferase involved in cell wall biosynthesis